MSKRKKKPAAELNLTVIPVREVHEPRPIEFEPVSREELLKRWGKR